MFVKRVFIFNKNKNLKNINSIELSEALEERNVETMILEIGELFFARLV